MRFPTQRESLRVLLHAATREINPEYARVRACWYNVNVYAGNRELNGAYARAE